MVTLKAHHNLKVGSQRASIVLLGKAWLTLRVQKWTLSRSDHVTHNFMT